MFHIHGFMCDWWHGSFLLWDDYLALTKGVSSVSTYLISVILLTETGEGAIVYSSYFSATLNVTIIVENAQVTFFNLKKKANIGKIYEL